MPRETKAKDSTIQATTASAQRLSEMQQPTVGCVVNLRDSMTLGKPTM
jgi:hypothetical protein